MATDSKHAWKPYAAGLALAFSTWSILPLPVTDYDAGKKHALSFFPLVGAVLGICFWLWTRLALLLGIERIPLALLSTALVILFSGGIHLDGFLDVSDALASGRDQEGKRTVLKDPRIGAFAVIRTIVLLLFHVAFLAETAYHQWLFVAAGFSLSRLIVVISIKSLAPAATSGMLAAFRPQVAAPFPEIVLFLLIFAAVALLYPLECLVLIMLTVALGAHYVRFTKRHFGGISGDTSGWLLSVYETAVVFAAALITWLR